MFVSLQDKDKSLPEQIADLITDMIMNQNLTVGEQLPNELELAKMINVGRGSIREGVRILVSRGVLEIRRGKGTFVAAHPGMVKDPIGLAFVPDKFKLALDILEIRKMFEPPVAALAAERATEEDIEQLRVLRRQVEEKIYLHLPHQERDMELHTKIAECTKNQITERLISVINSGIASAIDMTDSSLLEETIREHRAVIEAISRHDAEGAREAMLTHLTTNEVRIVLMHEAGLEDEDAS